MAISAGCRDPPVHDGPGLAITRRGTAHHSCHTANFLEHGLPTFAVVTNFAVTTNFQSGGWQVMKKSLVVKRSIVVGGHKTSVSLEDEFWAALKKIAVRHRVTLSDLVGSIDSQRQHGNLSSAVRLFVLQHYRQRVEETAHPDVWAATTETQPRKSIK
jgi:predicted DNA-binding ribbon-helix-helix protein